jgi:inosine-uridine nucleoside N-ribohydrolase
MIRKSYKVAVYFLIFSFLFAEGCSTGKKQKSVKSLSENKMQVIFETDIGEDIDDALALAMLNNYVDMGSIDLLAVMYNKDYLYSAKYIDMVDTWYGHPNIPIGKVVNGKKGNLTYAKKIVDMKENGKPVFKSSITDYKKLPEAVKLYRKLLWQADDSSVVIISVGFSTNLARLLKSGSDNIAPVSGKELVGKKVKFLSMMGGCFDGSIEREHNIIFDVHSAFELFEEWPTNIVVSPFEVGVKIRYPAVSIEHDFSYVRHHPVADAYKLFLKMPYNRPCWDLTSVLYAVEQDSSWFTLSPMGRVSVDTLTGKTFFTEVEGGSHRYLSVDSLCAAKIKQRLVQLVTLVPGRYRKTYSASILPVAYDRNNHQ